MFRYALIAIALGVIVLVVPQESRAQAGTRLNDLSGEDAQRKSWEQVDRINREADGTRSRNEQARKSAGLDKGKHTGGNVTKRHVLPETNKSDSKQSDTRKPDAKKQKSPPKKKSG